MIPYGRQSIDDDDVAAVTAVLKSDYLTTGPEVEAFEAELATACGVKHAVVVANGTAALHCAYAAAGLGPGKTLLTSPLTFSATANVALALGATVRFRDVDDDTLCMQSGGSADVVAPVHYAGRLASIDHAGVIVEDAAHALGTRGIARGALATLSFHPVKTITTGEGGAVLSDDPALAAAARAFRNHGMQRRSAWAYDVPTLGLNYRLTAMQCALGRSQLRKLDSFVAKRAAIAARYDLGLAGLPLRLPKPAPHTAWHLYAVRSPNRDRLMRELDKRGVGTQIHYAPVNGMTLYRQLGHAPEDTPIAMKACAELFSLPLFPGMTDAEVDHVIASVRAVCA